MDDSKVLARISELEDKLDDLRALTYETFQEVKAIVGNLTEAIRSITSTQLGASEMLLGIARRQGTPLDEGAVDGLLIALRKASEDPDLGLTPAEREERLRMDAEEHAKWTALARKSER